MGFSYDTFKWVTLCDSIVSFIIPLVLTAIADIGVFSRRSTSLMSVARERLGSRHDMHSQARSNSELSGLSQSQTSLAFDCAKIQSEQRIQVCSKKTGSLENNNNHFGCDNHTTFLGLGPLRSPLCCDPFKSFCVGCLFDNLGINC